MPNSAQQNQELEGRDKQEGNAEKGNLPAAPNRDGTARQFEPAGEGEAYSQTLLNVLLER